MQRAAVKTDLPRIRLHDVRQALEEHGLPGPARADHRKNTAALHGEIDSRQNHVVAEPLVQVLDFEQIILFGGTHDQTRKEVMT